MDAQTRILTRRSHRKYTEEKVSHEEIEMWRRCSPTGERIPPLGGKP